MHRNWKRFLPLIILIALILIVYITNLHQYLSLENLRKEEMRFKAFVLEHPILSPLVYLAIYVVSVVLIVPDSIILTLFAGLVFPLPLAFIYAVFSEVVGAIIFFAICRGSFGKTLLPRERPLVHKMRKEFHRYAPSYLLFLRISHVSPFWLINLSAAYFHINYWTFIWTCLVGVIPITYVLADAGHSLSAVFASGQHFGLRDVFTVELKIALILLGLLSFVPILYKKYIRKKRWKV